MYTYRYIYIYIYIVVPRVYVKLGLFKYLQSHDQARYCFATHKLTKRIRRSLQVSNGLSLSLGGDCWKVGIHLRMIAQVQAVQPQYKEP